MLPHLEFGYAVIALFALTQGPVYRLWSGSGESLVVSSRTSLAHVYFATFLAVQLPALIVVARTLTVEMLRNRSIQALIALHLWLGCTVLWSTLARQSLPEFIALVFTTSFGVFLALRFRPLQFWWIVLLAMTIGLLLSVVAVYRVWDTARDLNDGSWIGIYYNRNSLAPVAGVASIACPAVLFHGRSGRSSRRAVLTFLASLVGVLSVIILWQAGSRTTPYALFGASLVAVLYLLLRRVMPHARLGVLSRLGAARLSMGIAAIGVFIILRNAADVSSVPVETSTFNSRVALWSQNWSGFLEKPIQGWGWMAARYTDEFFRQGIWWGGFRTEWSHSGYHDVLLGGGVIAGVLLLTMIYFGLASSVRVNESWSEGIQVVTVGFVLIVATQESFFIGSHFLWALLIAALAKSARNDYKSE